MTQSGNPPGRLRAFAAGVSDVGLQREHNEDSFVVLPEFDLFIVADGMGGHRAGDVASRLATETIAAFFRSSVNEDVTWPFHFDTALTEEENRLLTGIRIANRQIFERSVNQRECRGMGTTVVGCLFSPRRGRMYIGHVGDSRCYRVRGGELQQLTRDHSLINDYLQAMPDLTAEQRAELPKNVITRALGMQDQVVVDLQSDEAQPGDAYVICSDGLSGMIDDPEILALVNAVDLDTTEHLVDACRRLIASANEHGGDDNVTVIIIRIADDARTTDSDELRAGRVAKFEDDDTGPGISAPPSRRGGATEAFETTSPGTEMIPADAFDTTLPTGLTAPGVSPFDKTMPGGIAAPVFDDAPPSQH